MFFRLFVQRTNFLGFREIECRNRWRRRLNRNDEPTLSGRPRAPERRNHRMNCSDRCAPVRRMGRSGPIAILALLALTVLPGTVSANYYRLWQGQAFAAGSGIGYAPPGYGDTENYSLTLFAPFTT